MFTRMGGMCKAISAECSRSFEPRESRHAVFISIDFGVSISLIIGKIVLARILFGAQIKFSRRTEAMMTSLQHSELIISGWRQQLLSAIVSSVIQVSNSILLWLLREPMVIIRSIHFGRCSSIVCEKCMERISESIKVLDSNNSMICMLRCECWSVTHVLPALTAIGLIEFQKQLVEEAFLFTRGPLDWRFRGLSHMNRKTSRTFSRK